MTYQNENNLDINEIQEENLKKLQKEILCDAQIKNLTEIPVLKTEDITVEQENIISFKEEETKEILAQDPLLQDLDKTLFQKWCWVLGSITKYILTASFIFVMLMAFTNYSAYITIAKSYLNPEAIAQSEKNMHKSLEVSQISVAKKQDWTLEEKTKKDLDEDIYRSKDLRSILWDVRKEDIQLDIEVIPFVNRMVIPKIGKNIPLVDIAQGKVEWLHELNDIFMEELQWGVVRYPGSARPWEFGNSFIFWHSSNFPWVKWDYNDVFALLDKLEIWDEVISYYEGKKYTYKIKQKKVINPNDVSILKRDTGKKEITLMTCWPIWTTYNRLLVIGELVK